MTPSVLVVGSIAFDIIFSIEHDFRQSIPVENGEIRNFNAVFMANEKTEFPGGTAGNIAYWLGQKYVRSSIFSAVGKDFDDKGYRTRLQNFGAEVRGTIGSFSAHAYMISDPLHQQIIIWQPNAYIENKAQQLADFYSPVELGAFEIAIFAAGTPDSIEAHMREFKKANPQAKIIFDPGQITHTFEKAGFQKCCDLSDIIVGNDIEFSFFRKMGLPKDITTIETFGAKGVTITENNIETKVTAVKAEKVVETTGAGDAFRAGLISGLLHGLSLPEAAAIGAELGAECVALPSGQGE